MIKTIDTRGLQCPEPVMMAHKTITSTDEKQFIILVDNGAPRDNVKRFAMVLEYTIEEEIFEDGFRLNLKK